MHPLELLAPAKNLECGIAAIDHGADAVYIGAISHGARVAAGNSIDDIKALCDYAHQFMAKVYVTVNTIVYEDELEKVEALLLDLEHAGVDAILVQDMAIVEIMQRLWAEGRVTMAIHASTQTDNRTPEKVAWLSGQGFSRVVLARELSIEEIAEIYRQVPNVELEAFVHGALCVSYSGVCYASQFCFRRSANRGECAQFCRLKFDLTDAEGRQIDKPRYWLSLKDMCRIEHLQQMAEAGVTSFKIEGRLKDVNYVKNVVAAYSQKLDEIIRHADGRWCRQALGRCGYAFTPNLRKTFNRGFTDYFVSGVRKNIASVDTPKAMGEYVGKVKEIRRDSFNVAGTAAFANGDGLCFFDQDKTLKGFRVNRAVGNRIFPQRMPQELKPGMGLYRNSDTAFEKALAGKSAVRQIPVKMMLRTIGHNISLLMSIVGADIEVDVQREIEMQKAQKPQEENMRRQMEKLGNTHYVAEEIHIDEQTATIFVPSSVLAELRREAIEMLDRKLAAESDKRRRTRKIGQVNHLPMPIPSIYTEYSYMFNVANHLARDFYVQNGQKGVGEAFELTKGNQKQKYVIMQCRHCIRQLMGYCSRDGKKVPWKEPLSMRLPDGRTFRLGFDCKNCQMLVYVG